MILSPWCDSLYYVSAVPGPLFWLVSVHLVVNPLTIISASAQTGRATAVPSVKGEPPEVSFYILHLLSAGALPL
jgi:hypothetical protein